MRFYISGGITGCVGYMERFNQAEELIKQTGHTAVNPAKVNSYLPEDTQWDDYMKVSFAMLSTCDTIYLLDGWSKSKGATKELYYALSHNYQIIEEGCL